MTRSIRNIATISAVAFGLVGLVAGTALGAGVPIGGLDTATSPGALWYSGQLTDPSGVPISGAAIGLTVSLWDDPTNTAVAHRKCMTATQYPTPVGGYFRMALDRDGLECVTAVHENPQLWVEVQVTGDATPLPRTPIGAVPYALEADRVTRTTVEGADGGAPVTAASSICGYGFATSPYTTGYFMSGGLHGLAAARAVCSGACGGSATAHMCTANEAVLSAQISALTIPTHYAWVAGDADFDATRSDGVRFRVGDCNSWAIGVHTMSGTAVWGGELIWDGGRTNYADCADSAPIACCD